MGFIFAKITQLCIQFPSTYFMDLVFFHVVDFKCFFLYEATVKPEQTDTDTDEVRGVHICSIN